MKEPCHEAAEHHGLRAVLCRDDVRILGEDVIFQHRADCIGRPRQEDPREERYVCLIVPVLSGKLGNNEVRGDASADRSSPKCSFQLDSLMIAFLASCMRFISSSSGGGNAGF